MRSQTLNSDTRRVSFQYTHGWYEVGCHVQVYRPAMRGFRATQFRYPAARSIGQPLVVCAIIFRHSGLAIAPTAHAQSPIARSIIGIGIRRCVPEQGEIVGEISFEGERVNARVRFDGWPHATEELPCLQGEAIRQRDMPATSLSRIFHDFIR